ncbi:MAG: NifB/NifX family molybdenum-iron cluster-binding protein [Firmicutes bacterium]|nr:NifB/NifX family molybdenum-iron cluster-binding protein [Bacillota bacterium]
MKIAISSQGSTIDHVVDERFGRTSSFIIYDLEDNSYQELDNTQVLNSPQGAGIQSAQHVVDAGVEAVITGHVGPKAFKVLQAGDVKTYLVRGITVKEAITEFKAGSLHHTESNDREDHWV